MRQLLRRCHLAILAIAIVMATGCTVLESRLDSDDPGLVYYLPKTMMRVEITVLKEPTDTVPSGTEFKVTTFHVPDLKHRYTLHYRRNPFFHDRLCYTLDDANPSLLSSVEVSTEDATPEIAVSLAQLVAKTSGQSPFDRSSLDALASIKTVTLQENERKIIVVVDLSDPKSLHEANQKIGKKFPGAKVVVPGIEHLHDDAGASCYQKGLCFRTAVRVPILLTHEGRTLAMAEREEPGPKTVGGMVKFPDFNVVNHRAIGNMDVDRAFMVEKVTRLGFSNGILTHVIVRKPSEVLGVVKLPLAVVDTLLAVPANFVNKITGPSPASVTAQATQLAALNAELVKITQANREAANAPLGDTAFKGVFKLQCSRATNGILAAPLQ